MVSPECRAVSAAFRYGTLGPLRPSRCGLPSRARAPLDPPSDQRVLELAKRIQEEPDPDKIPALVAELNTLLDSLSPSRAPEPPKHQEPGAGQHAGSQLFARGASTLSVDC
jgi:hypothetical protein